jgi:HK97 family phage major capsid protein
MARGSLTNADTADLVATVDHGGVPLARFPTTLALEDRDDGLHWSLELPSARADVREAVERGDLRATSWRMVVGRDEWRGDVRHVAEVAELRDVSLVTNPAYSEARAEYRGAPEPTTENTSAVADTTTAAEPQGDENMQTEDRDEQSEQRDGGGLAVEDRAAEAGPTIEQRVLDGLRSVRPGEARSLTTSTADPIAPPELSTFLFDKLRASSVALAAGIRVVPTDRESVQWPQITADVAPTWYGETDTITPGDPILATLTATPRKLAHIVELSNEVIDDREPAIVDVLNAHLATVLALKLDLSIFEGNPASNADSIRGLKYRAGIQTINLGTNGAALASYDALVEAVGMLRAANVPGPYAVVAHPRTVTDLALLKDETGSARQLARPADVPEIVASSQLSVTETKGTASNASSAYVFAPAQLVLVRRQDAAIELDRSRLFNQDMSELRGKLRADLLVPNPSAVVRIEGAIPA